MKKTLPFAAASVAILAGPSLAQTRSEVQDFVRMGSYLAVEDIQSSTAFYETLFDEIPMIALEEFVAFDIAGGTFALATKATYAPDALSGSGSVPYIQVTDVVALRDKFQERLERVLPAIIEEPGIKLLKITDPEGQLVEFYELAQN